MGDFAGSFSIEDGKRSPGAVGVNWTGVTFDVNNRVLVVTDGSSARPGRARGLINLSIAQIGRGAINTPGGVSAPTGRVIVALTVWVIVTLTVEVMRLGLRRTVPGRHPVGNIS